uniref:Uncharacterized protein n=1 Tax=Leersia perrieri TaxID=77586 RepID=A0A0D9X539_9ORYZ
MVSSIDRSWRREYGYAWDDLPPELVALIADSLPIKSYTRARAVCTSWFAALPPASPSALIRHDHPRRFSLTCLSSPPTTSTTLHESISTVLPPSSRGFFICSGDGWIGVYSFDNSMAFLVNPLTGEEIPFQHNLEEKRQMVFYKVVFAPNPTPTDFTAAAITGCARITYTIDGNRGWAHIYCPRDYIADVVYREKDGEKLVYCLTESGDVLVLRLPGDKAAMPAVFEPLFHATAPAFAPPYDTIVRTDCDKYIVICDDGTTLTTGCWLAVKDLNGYTVFVGKNNPVAIRMEDGTGNNVYWIDSSIAGRRAKRFDLATATSWLCFPDAQACCSWYFLGDAQCRVIFKNGL